MKLVFLGDSFTFSYGLEVERAIEKKYIDNYDENFLLPRNILFNSLSKQQEKELQDFRINNSWTFILSKKLKVESENISYPGSGIQQILSTFLDYELNNKNKNVVYLFFLPLTKQGRILIEVESTKNSFNQKLLHFFQTYLYHEEKDDINMFKNRFNENVFYVIYLNVLTTLIYYLKNKNIPFLFLPTWNKNIYEHFFNDNYKSNFINNLNFIRLLNNENQQNFKMTMFTS
jgi:hypothetical protein